MPSEKSSLLNGQQKGSNSQLSAGPLGDRIQHESFVNPKTTEQKVFVGFLFLMIVCLIALSFTVIFDAGVDQRNYSRDISVSDLAAFSSMDLLNSLYSGSGSTLKSGCESTLLLIRHCDKDTDADGVVHHEGNNYCSWLGRERSYFFASLFDDSPDNPRRRYPAPSQIFSLTEDRSNALESDSDGKKNYREIETVMPLANKFGLEIDVFGFDTQVIASEYFESLQSGDMCGKVTVISWKHEFLPDLALSLGCGPAEGCPRMYPVDTYDEVWQLKYVFDPHGKAFNSPKPMDLPVEINRQDQVIHPINGVDDGNKDADQVQVSGTDSNTTDSDTEDIPNRRLKKFKNHIGGKDKKSKAESRHPNKHPTKYQKWSVYGTKTFQHFDPLQFSTFVGDYPAGGSPTGGKWADEL